MNQTKLICDLCAVVEQQNAIIQTQAMELAQFSAVAAEDVRLEVLDGKAP